MLYAAPLEIERHAIRQSPGAGQSVESVNGKILGLHDDRETAPNPPISGGNAGGGRRRVVLFLQGPASPFLRRVADRVAAAGHEVRHVAYCFGDLVFWSVLTGRRLSERLPAPPTVFDRGRREGRGDRLARLIERDGVTDVVMLGDGRPVHATAVEVAMARGVRIHILEHGYIRPDWLTLEPDGMSGHSRMPRDPEQLRAMAAGLPPVDLTPLWPASFLRYALYDFAYHLPNVLLGPFVHPHHRTHGAVPPPVEYAGWAWKFLKAPFERRHLGRVLPTYLGDGPPFFLFPLQLPGDYQILRHAPGGDLFRIVEATIASFARSAPAGTRLLFKVHPIDNGLSRWHRRIGDHARSAGVGDRVDVVDGGPLDALVARAAGTVLVNSTVGTAVLAAGRPLHVLGEAVFAVPGLVSPGALDDFWRAPTPPDPDLAEAFLRVLVDRIQLRGGFIAPDSVEFGSRAVAARLLEDEERLPISLRRPRSPKPT